ncbi:hypothetical protein Hs30E_10410 [Lactococcus hodotermopsidis]|uniref:Uncharacterized protein n=1 Tax=Pseudolactococcus hodotermopsidis TaxID=2709157 RepID=A0A6A0BAQ9_9LACT|nr:hypothetical protein [Lactococcus hodotermopsidis]GFH42490.1 hypothetical protein Hs30E_10410 [Lactococcus hodotermopsidis]
MIQREWIRIGACGVIGLILGIIMAINNSTWYYALLGPFYAIGTFYGIKLILTMLGGVGKAAGKGLFSSIAGGHWIGMLVVIVLMVFVVGKILTFGWILGMFAAGKALFDAYRTDSDIGGSSSSNYDTSWDGVGSSSSSSRSKKGKSSSNDDYDNTSW